VRVHIHTHDPAALIARAAQSGQLSRLKVEDMTAQHHEVLERAAAEESATGQPAQPRPAAIGPAPRKTLGIVSVAPGEGFRNILEGIGADQVVEGGQTMNPSIENLLDAVRATNAESVIILPNNGNVILTAQQVDSLAPEIDVRVVPSKNLPQGISALLAVDPGDDVDGNYRRMENAMESVTAVELTHAVRDSVAQGKEIRSGDLIALVDDEISQVGHQPVDLVEAVLADRKHPPELITVYRGAGVEEDEAEGLVDALRSRHPEVEFEVHEGGQEHYPYILSLE